MSRRTAPALIALAIVMLTGCKQPIGLPGNRVNIAATCTTYCTVGSGSILSGRVEQRVDGGTPYTYTTYEGDIRREYGESGGYPDPRTYGFCVFDVPYFESPGGTPACTLFYYQTYRDGSLDLTFKWLPDVASWQPSAFVLFSAIDTSSYVLAPRQIAQSNGWCKLALSEQGSEWLEDCAGSALPTGWKHTNAQDGWRTDVTGVDPTYDPYVKVVYYTN